MNLQEFVNSSNNFDRFPHCFFSPFSRLGVSFSANDAKLQLAFAKAINPGEKSHKREKGEQVYVKEQKYFTLSPSECHTFMQNFKKVIDGTYEYKPKPNEKVNEKYKNYLQFKHYITNSTSVCSFAQHLVKDRPVGLKVTFISGGDTDTLVSYVLSGAELALFVKFVEAGAYQAPIILQFIKMMLKKCNQVISSSEEGTTYKKYNKTAKKEEESEYDDNDLIDEDIEETTHSKNTSSKKQENDSKEESEDSDDDGVPW